MSEMDILFPIPDSRRNADDMGMPITPNYSDLYNDNKKLRALLRECLPEISGHLRDKVMQALGSE